MKKLLLSIMLSAVCLGVYAQKGTTENTMFWSFNLGGTLYQKVKTNSFSIPVAGVNVGYRLSRPLALRFDADVVLAPTRYHLKYDESGNGLFLMAGANFVWNVNASFFDDKNSFFALPIPFYPIIGAGVALRPPLVVHDKTRETDFGIFTMVGLNVPMRISSSWDLYLEYKCRFFLHTFDQNTSSTYMHNLVLGLNYRIPDDPHTGTSLKPRHSDSKWFAGLGVGVSFASYDFEHFTDNDARYWNLTPEIMVGRSYSDNLSIRCELSGLSSRRHAETDTLTGKLLVGDEYYYNYFHTDFMFNLNSITGINRDGKWNFMPYLGAGPIWSYGDEPHFAATVDGGLFIRRAVGDVSNFYLDLKYVMIPPRISMGKGASQSMFGVGAPMLTFGYLCNF